ncbi:MAG: SGNH/GDSL hydrolase family protein [Candidatus Omnitrophica bacterium]|nr:SGNH/GDSL hydrolase family protein [Candidatus Omnitrophota bacterium]
MNKKPFKWVGSSFLLIILLFFIFPVAANAEIRYVALGDSYSIGTGVSSQEAWPNVLVGLLQADGLKIELVANPSRNGWTTQNAQEWEIAVYREAKPTFATLMIGVNDWLQYSTAERFRANFTDLLDDMLSELPAKKILVVNIPDFSATPKGAVFTPGRNIAKGITKFNKIIAKVCRQKGIALVDVYSVSQQMRFDSSLVAGDGMHPSAEGQRLFAQTIYPFAKKILEIP